MLLARARSRALVPVVVTGALTLLGAACSDDDDASGATTTEAEASTTTTEADAATTSTAAADETEPPVVAVTAADYAFSGLPSSTPAGTRLTMHNTSTKEVHEIVAFRIPDSETRSVDELVKLPMNELMQVFGGPPATVLVAPPGSDAFPAVGDGTLTQPGRYLLLCAIPTGADPQAYLEAAQQSQGGPVDVPGGPPHFVQGMYAELEVS